MRLVNALPDFPRLFVFSDIKDALSKVKIDFIFKDVELFDFNNILLTEKIWLSVGFKPESNNALVSNFQLSKNYSNALVELPTNAAVLKSMLEMIEKEYAGNRLLHLILRVARDRMRSSINASFNQIKDLQKQIEKYNGSLKKLDLMSWSWSPSEVANDKPDS